MLTDWSPCTNLLVIEQMTPQLRGLKQHSFIYHKAGAASQIPPGGLGLLTAWPLHAMPASTGVPVAFHDDRYTETSTVTKATKSKVGGGLSFHLFPALGGGWEILEEPVGKKRKLRLLLVYRLPAKGRCWETGGGKLASAKGSWKKALDSVIVWSPSVRTGVALVPFNRGGS